MKIVKKIESLIFWKYSHLVFYFIISIAVLSKLLSPGYILTLDMLFVPNIGFSDSYFGLKESLGGQVPFLYTLQVIGRILPSQIV